MVFYEGLWLGRRSGEGVGVGMDGQMLVVKAHHQWARGSGCGGGGNVGKSLWG